LERVLEHEAITLQGERLHVGGAAFALGVPGLLVGAAALAAAAWWAFGKPTAGMMDWTTHFFHAYLAAYVFFMAITLGALGFVLIHHLTRAGWSVTVRRLAEGLSLNMFLLVVLALPFFVTVNGQDGVHRLFPHWFVPAGQQHEEGLLAKAGYLNPSFFGIRMGVYFVVWCLLAWYMALRSAQQDRDGDVRATRAMERMAFPAILFYGFSLTAFIVDWVMALNPHWFSTIFGVYYFAACMLSGYAAIVLLAVTLQKRGLMGRAVNTEHYHDLGKWMFAFTFFWGYIAFSQYMLIWYANMPEETQFFIPRQWGVWGSVSLMLLLVHVLIPFPGLLSRGVKRRTGVLAFWAVWVLGACAVDACWMVLPNQWINRVAEFAGDERMGLPQAMAMVVDRYDVYHVTNGELARAVNFPLTAGAMGITALCFVGIGGLYVFSTMMALRGKALVPMRDPRLGESLAFENI
jgi:hypothetical protein